jgi:hypothetical protein
MFVEEQAKQILCDLGVTSKNTWGSGGQSHMENKRCGVELAVEKDGEV